MPLILDEISVSHDLEIHGIQGCVVVTVQKIRPTADDGDQFPAGLIDQSVGVLSVYPRDHGITPFSLNARQTLEYMKHPQGHTIDIYGRDHLYDVECTELPHGEPHIMQHRRDGVFSIGHFELDGLKRCVDSVYTDHPEFFT